MGWSTALTGFIDLGEGPSALVLLASLRGGRNTLQGREPVIHLTSSRYAGPMTSPRPIVLGSNFFLVQEQPLFLVISQDDLWIRISLMISDVECIVLYVLAIYMYSLEKYLFKSFAHFLIGFLVLFCY